MISFWSSGVGTSPVVKVSSYGVEGGLLVVRRPHRAVQAEHEGGILLHVVGYVQSVLTVLAAYLDADSLVYLCPC